MKKLLYTLLAVSIIFSACKKEDEEPNNTNNFGNSSIYTYVPDNNFEIALINLGFDNSLNDTVLTAKIDTLTYLDVNYLNIADLTGIEAFTALTHLECVSNQLTSLDVSNNTNLTELSCQHNQLTSLDVSNNTALTYLNCSANQLTSLDVSNNTALTYLQCGANKLTSLDVSNNTALVELYCHSNKLIYLDVRNGNNTNMYSTYAALPDGALYAGCYTFMNPNLYCIDVDDASWSTTNWFAIDSQSFFSVDCNTK